MVKNLFGRDAILGAIVGAVVASIGWIVLFQSAAVSLSRGEIYKTRTNINKLFVAPASGDISEWVGAIHHVDDPTPGHDIAATCDYQTSFNCSVHIFTVLRN